MKSVFAVLILLGLSFSLHAQTGTLSGQVADVTGAVVPGAKVTITGPHGIVKTATSGQDGSYSVAGLPPGIYTVVATAPDLTQPQPAKVTLGTGVQTLNLQLKVAEVVQQVTVQESSAPALSTEPSGNASALVLRGTDLDALPDDPDDLQQDLQALAGPSAGPNGGEIMIDGFSNGTLPPKNSIREIRINQNPFSPEYSKLGYGRIEIFTKPGTDKFHGYGFFNLGDDVWNSRNPYAAQKAPFLLKEYGGNVSGPLSKKMSFFVNVERREIDNGAVINGVTLDPQTFNIIDPYTAVLNTPQRRTRITPRVDYQIGQNDTLMMRYGYTRNDVQDAGIGGFNLVSRGYTNFNSDQTGQITETHVMGTTINETRFQYYHVLGDTLANNTTPSILVLGSFNGGGAQLGHSTDVENYYELQNYTTANKGAHTWKYGVRLRGETDANVSPNNFGGTYTFGGGSEPLLDANNQPVIGPDGQPVLTQITSIQQYQRTLLGLPGGVPTQFTLVSGIPGLSVHQFDMGAFAGDDWRVKPNVTLSLGLRWETQTNIHDWRDFAPRIAFAWAPGASKIALHPAFVIRGGFGMFYDRFGVGNTLTADRFNGEVQQQYVVTNPAFFPMVPPVSALSDAEAVRSAVYKVDSNMRAPYLMQSALSVERQLPGKTTVSVTYTNTHGLHEFRSEDINSPLPGTYNPLLPGSGVYPYGVTGPMFLMQSSGLYNQNQMVVNVNSRMNENLTLFGFYTLNFVNSNTDGLGTYRANPYNEDGEYGPASTDIRNRVFFGGSFNSRWNIRISPFLILQSGAPYDITVGRDLYGDTLLNGRPGIPTDLTKPGLIRTQYGLLDPNPTPGETILPRNFGRGPGQITFNMRLSKTFGFGPERNTGGGSGGGDHGHHGGGAYGGGGFHSIFGDTSTSHRYNLTLSISARNLLNHVNPGMITGNITSPLFGQANSIAGGYGAFAESANNRRLELQMRFTF